MDTWTSPHRSQPRLPPAGTDQQEDDFPSIDSMTSEQEAIRTELLHAYVSNPDPDFAIVDLGMLTAGGRAQFGLVARRDLRKGTTAFYGLNMEAPEAEED